MLSLLLAGPRTSLAEGALMDAVAKALREAGHDVDELAPGAVQSDLGELDGVLVVADGYVPESCAAQLGLARAAGRLAILVHSDDSVLAPLATHARRVADLAAFPAAATALVKDATPHAGRLVRDQVPRLVREAGHPIRFREATAEERPAALKRKVAEHARGLERSGLADEKEEATDLLEALEALIRTRGWDREELKLLKASKLKRRGGFERCFVVDGTEQAAPAAQAVPPAAATATPPAPAPPATAPTIFPGLQGAATTGSGLDVAPLPPKPAASPAQAPVEREPLLHDI